MAEFDDVCEIVDGVCRRHGVRHEGRHLRLSQDRSSVGHGYRRQWDRVKAAVGVADKKCGCGTKRGKLT